MTRYEVIRLGPVGCVCVYIFQNGFKCFKCLRKCMRQKTVAKEKREFRKLKEFGIFSVIKKKTRHFRRLIAFFLG